MAGSLGVCGCGGDKPTPTPGTTNATTYSVSVAVSGLQANTSFTITDSDHPGASAVVNSNGTFTLDTGLSSGASYDATLTSPTGQSCTFPNSATSSSGTLSSANITLSITCAATTSIALNGPAGLVFDATSTHLYVANENGNQVLIYSVAELANNTGAVIPALAQTGSITNAINKPVRLALDEAGYLYVANLGSSTISVYNPTASLTQVVTTISTGLSQPEGVAVDQNGNVYVGNGGSNTITVYSGSPAGGFTLSATLSHDGAGNSFQTPSALMFSNFSGSYNALFAGLSPSGASNSALVYAAPLTSTSIPAGSLTNSSCATGPTGPTAIATNGQVASSSSGAIGSPSATPIFIANSGNNNIAEYTLSQFSGTGCVTPVAVSVTASQISQPAGLAVDADGIVYVSNAGTSTITVYDSILQAPIITLR